MNNIPWVNVSEFDLDDPMSEYGFSTRLANENYWTRDFTKKAIVEYKKFMYLAGTSDFMVSPSEIVDVVWHQHLIFTNSYTEFCNILGKNIQHVPSTHNKEDHEKFRQAKERTKKLYNETFGEQPPEIWDYSDMYESLHLPKAKWKIRTFLVIGILAFIALIGPFYQVLYPLYIKIDNPYFIIGYLILILLAFIFLETYNRQQLMKIVAGFSRFSFIHSLQPPELVFLKTDKLTNVIHGEIDQLIRDGKVEVTSGSAIEMVSTAAPRTLEEFTIAGTLSELGRVHYPTLLRQLVVKPVFTNIPNAMNAFKKWFSKSKAFGRLFYLNFIVLAFVIMIGLIRFSTGIMRDRPVLLIFLAFLFLTCTAGVYLWRLPNLIATHTIPKHYSKILLPEREYAGNYEWQYFLLGTAFLSPSFIPMVTPIEQSSTWTSGGSSCGTGGSSCGSSCSSCGGCGGGGD